MKNTLRCSLAIMLSLLFGFSLISCREARTPEKSTDEQPVGAEEPTDDVESDVRVLPAITIQALVSGAEFELENMKFTHMAISADEDYEFEVKVTVEVNDVPAGILYADGWQDESPEKLRISGGDTSKWVPIRGNWNSHTGINLMKLTFGIPTLKGLDTPPMYFEGKLWLKYDPDADESTEAPLADEGEIEESETESPAD